MDWSFSPLKALYFALEHDCSDESSTVQVFNPWLYRGKIFSKSIRSSSHSHEMHILGRALLADHSVEEVRNILKVEFYGECLSEEDLRLPFPFVAKFANNRIIHQSGAFTIQGSARRTALDTFDELASESAIIQSIEIPKASREGLMSELNMLFINHYTIYPDLQGMGDHLERYKSLYSIEQQPKKES